jgi:hypothetical protein
MVSFAEKAGETVAIMMMGESPAGIAVRRNPTLPPPPPALDVIMLLVGVTFAPAPGD